MNRATVLSAAPALLLAGCGGGAISSLVSPRGNARRAPLDQNSWIINNFSVLFSPGEPKFGTPPSLGWNDTNFSPPLYAGQMYPTDSTTIGFFFQDPDYFDGDQCNRLVTFDPNHSGVWLKRHMLKLFRKFVWEVDPNDPRGPGGQLLDDGTPSFGFYYADQMIAVDYQLDQTYETGLNLPPHKKGPYDRRGCQIAIAGYWAALAGILGTAFGARGGARGPGLWLGAAGAVLTLLAAELNLEKECGY